VRRTLQWARRCRSEFDRQWEQQCDKQAAERPRSAAEGVARPLLFAVVQGGGSRDLRKRCADGLLEMGFDGYGLGGWPLDSQGHLLLDIIAYIRELIPGTFPLHALGVGQPANVVACAQLGFGLFDSTMPTRDARHGRLYRFSSAPSRSTLSGDWFSYVYISDAQHIRADAPISPYCDCLCCSRYSLAYLHHLFRIKDTLFYRLATIHNLRFMVQLMDQLRLRLPGTGNGPGKPKTGHSEHG